MKIYKFLNSRVSLFQFSVVENKGKITGIAIVLVIFLALLFSAIGYNLLSRQVDGSPNVFVGVDVGYGNESDVYRVADAIAGYANLIIIGSTDVTNDTAALTRVCDYLYQRNFYFIIYVGFAENGYFPPQGPDSSFFTQNQDRWGGKLLGAYIFDEPGGKQLDANRSNKPVPTANNDNDAAIHFLFDVNSYSNLYKNTFYSSPDMRLFTSDYGLYWYDYLSNYDVVFGEFYGNISRPLTIALTRGAAEAQDKNWGTIITWSGSTPSLENGTQIYSDLVLAYQNGAKYLVVFDSLGNASQPITPLGILTSDQLDGIKNFWNYAQSHSRPEKNPAQTAYVLPQDLGFGFRGENDSIWGLWPSNATTLKVWNDANALVANGTKFDIVYETKTDDILIPSLQNYKTLIYWNGTAITK